MDLASVQSHEAKGHKEQGTIATTGVPRSGCPNPKSKRDIIIEAASGCFLADGYSTTSMDQVAATAGVAKQTLYHHFGSKNGLFEATLQHVTQDITHVLQERQTPDHGPKKTLLRFGSDVLELSLRPQSVAFIRLLIAEAGKHRDAIDSLVRRALDSISETLANYLRDQTERQRLNVEDPRHAAQMFLGMLAGELRLRALLGVPPELSPAARDRHLKMTVHAFLRAFAP